MKEVRTDNDDCYLLAHQLQGSATLNIGECAAKLEPGDMVVLKAAKKSEFNFLSLACPTKYRFAYRASLSKKLIPPPPKSWAKQFQEGPT